MRATSAVLIFTGLVLVSCNDNGVTTPPGEAIPTGEYILLTIADESPPYLHPGNAYVTLSESFFIEDERRYSQSRTACEVGTVEECRGNAVEHRHDIRGHYGVEGTTITFQEETFGQLRFTGHINSERTRLTIDIDHPRLGASRRVYALKDE